MTGALPRVLRHIATATVAAFLAYEVVTIALASGAHLRGDEPRALGLRPHSVSVAVAASQKALQEGRAADATSLALQGLGSSPFDPEPLVMLALARTALAEPKAANRLMGVAARGGWRNPAVQIWMIETALAQGNGPVAVLRADALLRQGLLVDEMTILLRGLTDDRSARETVVSRLAENPPWRGQFLTSIGALTPVNYDGHERLLVQLVRAGIDLKPEETNNYLSHLITKGEPERALGVWRQIRATPHEGGFLEDPRLTRVADADETPSPFSWIIKPTPGLSVTRGEEKAGGAEVTFDGTGSVKALEQTLVLSPGRHRIEMRWAPINEGQTGQSLSWQVACAPGSPLPSEASNAAVADGRGRVTAGIITVPNVDCRAQRLEIWMENKTLDPSPLRLSSVSVSHR